MVPSCYNCKHEEVCYIKRDLFETSYLELCKVFDSHYRSESDLSSNEVFAVMLAENCKHFIGLKGGSFKITGESLVDACERIVSASDKALCPSDVKTILKGENHPRCKLKSFGSNTCHCLTKLAGSGKIERCETAGIPCYKSRV